MNENGTKCGKGAYFTTKMNDDCLKKLKISPIKIIRLETSEGYFDIETISIPDYFIRNLDCLDK
jgi:hypothetical protein